MKKPPVRRQAQPEQTHSDSSNAVVAAEWYGPLPPPSILADFNRVVDNGAERIFAAWEGETAHRHDMEKRDLRFAGIDLLMGKVFAFLFVVATLAVCILALYWGAEWFATIIGGGTITSVVWAFVKSHRSGSNDGDKGQHK